MSPRLPAVLLAAVLGLTAAGTAAALRRSTADDDPPPDPRAAVVDALSALPGGGADSARYVVRYLLVGPGVEASTATFDGRADFVRQRFRARGTVSPQDGPATDFDSFVLARWEYVRPVGERHWDRRFFNPATVGTPTPELAIVGQREEALAAPSYAGDPRARRLIVDALVADVAATGRETQHGAAVWRYRVSVDGERAAARLPVDLRSEMEAWQEDEPSREVDVWLDGRGRLRKLSVLYPDEEGRGVRVENEFWDFGGPGRLDLPDDLDDPTAAGGEGTTAFTVGPGVDLDQDSPGFTVQVFDDEPGENVHVTVRDRPAPGADSRRRVVRLNPAAGRNVEEGEYRLVDRAEFDRGVPRTFDVSSPEVDARCPRDRPRSGTLTVDEAVMYEDDFYVRLHLRFRVTCGSESASVQGELRFHALT